MRERVEEVERRVRGEDKDVSPEGGEEGKLDQGANSEKLEDDDGANEEEESKAGNESMLEDAVEVDIEVDEDETF